MNIIIAIYLVLLTIVNLIIAVCKYDITKGVDGYIVKKMVSDKDFTGKEISLAGIIMTITSVSKTWKVDVLINIIVIVIIATGFLTSMIPVILILLLLPAYHAIESHRFGRLIDANRTI